MRIRHLLKRLSLPATYGLAGWALACPLSGQAATANVSIEDFDFNPPSTTINVNDQVTWTWNGIFSHSTTSDTGLWTSVQQTSGTYTHIFSSSGNFPYHCSVHLFMTASVTVNPGSAPPSVTINSPTNGATFAAPWTGSIQATVSDTGGTVTNVDFFAGATLLGSVNNPTANPSFTVTNLPANNNNYVLTAAATDNNGATTTSAGVSINVVTPGTIVLSSPVRVSATSFQFSYTANPGLSYIVLRSGTLPGLLPISTNTATSSMVNFLDNNATGDANYYDVHLAPNP
jgi:plastocyanin